MGRHFGNLYSLRLPLTSIVSLKRSSHGDQAQTQIENKGIRASEHERAAAPEREPRERAPLTQDSGCGREERDA
ncbi:MAG: hypothetical protein ACJ8J7_10950 [Sulfurifustaceae bacterium]